MGDKPEHIKFFRYDSPLVLSGEGSPTDLWLAESVLYLDIAKERILREFFLIAYHSRGGFTLSDIMKMNYNDYLIIVKEALRIQKMIKDEMEESANE